VSNPEHFIENGWPSSPVDTIAALARTLDTQRAELERLRANLKRNEEAPIAWLVRGEHPDRIIEVLNLAEEACWGSQTGSEAVRACLFELSAARLRLQRLAESEASLR
jgi:hypothetical protein